MERVQFHVQPDASNDAWDSMDGSDDADGDLAVSEAGPPAGPPCYPPLEATPAGPPCYPPLEATPDHFTRTFCLEDSLESSNDSSHQSGSAARSVSGENVVSRSTLQHSQKTDHSTHVSGQEQKTRRKPKRKRRGNTDSTVSYFSGGAERQNSKPEGAGSLTPGKGAETRGGGGGKVKEDAESGELQDHSGDDGGVGRTQAATRERQQQGADGSDSPRLDAAVGGEGGQRPVSGRSLHGPDLETGPQLDGAGEGAGQSPPPCPSQHQPQAPDSEEGLEMLTLCKWPL